MYAPNGEPPSGPIINRSCRSRNPGYCLDDTLYHRVAMKDIPSGHSSVPVKVDDNGVLYETIMVAGSMGIRARSTGVALDENDTRANSRRSHLDSSGNMIPGEHHPGAPQAEPGLDSLQPESGWFMFEKIREPEDEDAERGEVELYASDKASELNKNHTMRAPLPLSTKFKERLENWRIQPLLD